MNKQSIHILRGSRESILNKSENVQLDAGQPLYNSTDNYLTIGGGETNNDASLLTKLPIASREIHGYFEDNNGLSNSENLTEYHVKPINNKTLELASDKIQFKDANGIVDLTYLKNNVQHKNTTKYALYSTTPNGDDLTYFASSAIPYNIISRDHLGRAQVTTPEDKDNNANAKDIINREFLTKKLEEFKPTVIEGDYLKTTGGILTGDVYTNSKIGLADDTVDENGIVTKAGYLGFGWGSYIEFPVSSNKYGVGSFRLNRDKLENLYNISNAINVSDRKTWIKTDVQADDLDVKNVTAESVDASSVNATSSQAVYDSTRGVYKKMRVSTNAYDTFSQIQFETGHISPDGSQLWDIPGNTLNLTVSSKENLDSFQSYNVSIPWPKLRYINGDYFYQGTVAFQEDIEEQYQKKINIENKLSADLIDTDNTSRKFATEEQLTSIDRIASIVPSTAYEGQNELADKEFVNSSIATNTATFRGTFEAEDNLPIIDGIIKLNDYAFIIKTDAEGNPEYNRYKFNGTTWEFEYTLNNSSFTAEQWATINSGITKTEVESKLDKIEPSWNGAYLLYGVIRDESGNIIQNAKEYTSNAHNDTLPIRDGYYNFQVGNRQTGMSGGYVANYNYVDEKVANKQDTLISGSNIKTINNQSILGEGNITITTNDIEVDQTYNPTSANAQSGTAVAEAISNIQIQTPVQSDWNETDTTSLAYIKNKLPIRAITIPSSSQPGSSFDLDTLTSNGQYVVTVADMTHSIDHKPSFVPYIASIWVEVEFDYDTGYTTQYVTYQNWIGYRTMPARGAWSAWTEINLLESKPEPQVQADWTETNTDSLAYIKNKPDLSTKQDKLKIQTTGWVNNLSGLTLGAGWQYTYNGNDVPDSKFPLLTIGKTYLLNYELDIPLTDTVQEGKTYFTTGDMIGIRNNLNTSVFELSNVHYQIANNGQPLTGAKAQFSCIYKQDRPSGVSPETTAIRVSAQVFSSKDITNPVSLKFKITAIQLD